jgi:hypothetical protein
MSKFSQRILSSIDYRHIKETRIQNFQFLHDKLANVNEIKLGDRYSHFCYPLYLKDGQAYRSKLILNKVFIPQYWKSVLNSEYSNDYDKLLAQNILPLPIDQRYGLSEMKFIIDRLGI